MLASKVWERREHYGSHLHEESNSFEVINCLGCNIYKVFKGCGDKREALEQQAEAAME